MDERECGLETLVVEVGIELRQLLGDEHPLVDEGAGGQRREVDPGLALHALARDERPPIELDVAERGCALRRGKEQVLEGRHGVARHLADHGVVGGHIPPRDDAQVFARGDLLDRRHHRFAVRSRTRQERAPDGIGAGRRQLDADDRPQEAIRNLDEDPGAVADVGLGTGRSPMVEVAERRDAEVDHSVRLPAVHVDDEPDTARVMLERRVVQALLVRHRSHPVGRRIGSVRSRRSRDNIGPTAVPQIVVRTSCGRRVETACEPVRGSPDYLLSQSLWACFF